MESVKKAEIIEALQTDIIRMQGFKPSTHSTFDSGLGPINHSFPDKIFPLGQIHEFLTDHKEDSSASCGFIAGLLGQLVGNNGTILWISSGRCIFPPGLKMHGVQPDRCIFVEPKKEKDVFWITNEALKCGALTAVVGEMRELTFTESRRLQIAVEESKVTGFILRKNFRKLNTTACVSRWRITSLPSEPIESLPGIGFPKWKVELLRIRNGKPSAWNVLWFNGKFVVTAADRPYPLYGQEDHNDSHRLIAATGKP